MVRYLLQSCKRHNDILCQKYRPLNAKIHQVLTLGFKDGKELLLEFWIFLALDRMLFEHERTIFAAQMVSIHCKQLDKGAPALMSMLQVLYRECSFIKSLQENNQNREELQYLQMMEQTRCFFDDTRLFLIHLTCEIDLHSLWRYFFRVARGILTYWSWQFAR